VLRMTFRSALVMTAFALSSSVYAQQVHPEESLNEATQLLGTMTAGPGAPDSRIAALKQDFTDFAAAYLAAPGTAPPATATSGAVGTSGRSDAAHGDWRAKYQRVEADLTALLGPAGGTQPAAAASLDPNTRARLEDVRSRLHMFYAATLGQPGGNPVAHTASTQTSAAVAQAPARPPVAPTAEAPQTTRADAGQAGQAGQASQPNAMPNATVAAAAQRTATPQVDTQWGSALAMLDRMQRILDDAIKDPGKVAIDRAAIDELRAEIAQIRTLLRSGKN
jgi:hypothetical protein